MISSAENVAVETCSSPQLGRDAGADLDSEEPHIDDDFVVAGLPAPSPRPWIARPRRTYLKDRSGFLRSKRSVLEADRSGFGGKQITSAPALQQGRTAAYNQWPHLTHGFAARR